MAGAAGFERLVEIMRSLRAPDGCPWDREQDLASLQPMLIEEVYEVVEAVDNGDLPALSEELGDLLLHVVFHAELGREQHAFDIDDVVQGICDKLVRRHPHVFGGATAADASEGLANWEAIKKREKASVSGRRDRDPASILDGIPPRLPALYEAHKISDRVARRGFDWDTIDGVFDKLAEETRELRAARTIEDPDRRSREVEEEIGDMLFVVVNIARHLGVDTERALKRSNRKFIRRFRHMESSLARQGRSLEESGPEELEALWRAAKAGERGG